MGSDNAVLEFVVLTHAWTRRLVLFLQALQKCGDAQFFSPHPADYEAIEALAYGVKKDLYFLLVEGENILGYGMLRGWDEGYEIPSLGIAIHPSARGLGLGRLVMHFLHASAARKGAKKVRLRVRKDNQKAVKLYKELGYVLTKDTSDYLVGLKSLPGR